MMLCSRLIINDITSPLLALLLKKKKKKNQLSRPQKNRVRKEPLADMGGDVSGGGTEGEKERDHQWFLDFPVQSLSAGSKKHNITGRTCPLGPNAPTAEESLVQSEARSRSAEFPRTEPSGSWGEREDPGQTPAGAPQTRCAAFAHM